MEITLEKFLAHTCRIVSIEPMNSTEKDGSHLFIVHDKNYKHAANSLENLFKNINKQEKHRVTAAARIKHQHVPVVNDYIGGNDDNDMSELMAWMESLPEIEGESNDIPTEVDVPLTFKGLKPRNQTKTKKQLYVDTVTTPVRKNTSNKMEDDNSDNTKKTNNIIQSMMTTETLNSELTEMQTKILTKVTEDQAAAERRWKEVQAADKARSRRERTEDLAAAEKRHNKSQADLMKNARETREADQAMFKTLEEKKEARYKEDLARHKKEIADNKARYKKERADNKARHKAELKRQEARYKEEQEQHKKERKEDEERHKREEERKEAQRVKEKLEEEAQRVKEEKGKKKQNMQENVRKISRIEKNQNVYNEKQIDKMLISSK